MYMYMYDFTDAMTFLFSGRDMTVCQFGTQAMRASFWCITNFEELAPKGSSIMGNVMYMYLCMYSQSHLG